MSAEGDPDLEPDAAAVEDPEIGRLRAQLAATSQPESALTAGRALLRRTPADVDALHATARAYAHYDRADEALALASRASLLAPERTELVLFLTEQAARTDQLHLALCATMRLLNMEPFNARARLLLAALYGSLGHDDLARPHARRAAGSQPLLEPPPPAAKRLTLLVLQTVASGGCRVSGGSTGVRIGAGHNNLPDLLDHEHIAQTILRVDGLPDHPDMAADLPPIDLVYNSIADPGHCGHALETAAAFCRQIASMRGTPVVNAPDHVLACSRTNLAEGLKDTGLYVPLSVSLGEQSGDITELVRKTIADTALLPPVILRALGTRGERNRYRVTDTAYCAIELKQPAEVFLEQHHDVSYIDHRLPDRRLHPRYRAVLVGDRLFACHRRVVADDFRAHEEASLALARAHAWLREEEQNYIDDPANHLPAGRWGQLERTLQRLQLDYVGVDFAPTSSAAGDDAGLVLFEVSAAMRNPLLDPMENDAVRRAWQRINRAVHDHLCARAGIEAWEPTLPEAASGAAS